MQGRVWVAWVSLFAAIGCGSSNDHRVGPTVPTGDDDGGAEMCIDEDGDGYGRFCSRGKDCDDSDPKITDECRRCGTPAKDCPCTPGTAATRCDPPVQHVDGGILVCSEGSRYCLDGYWGDCKTIGDYVFVAQ